METVKCNLDPSFEIDENLQNWYVVHLRLSRHDPVNKRYNETEKLMPFKGKSEWLNFKHSLEVGHAFMIDASHVQSCVLVNDPEVKKGQFKSANKDIDVKHRPQEIELAIVESPAEERARLKREAKTNE